MNTNGVGAVHIWNPNGARYGRQSLSLVRLPRCRADLRSHKRRGSNAPMEPQCGVLRAQKVCFQKGAPTLPNRLAKSQKARELCAYGALLEHAAGAKGLVLLAFHAVEQACEVSNVAEAVHIWSPNGARWRRKRLDL